MRLSQNSPFSGDCAQEDLLFGGTGYFVYICEFVICMTSGCRWVYVCEFPLAYWDIVSLIFEKKTVVCKLATRQCLFSWDLGAPRHSHTHLGCLDDWRHSDTRGVMIVAGRYLSMEILFMCFISIQFMCAMSRLGLDAMSPYLDLVSSQPLKNFPNQYCKL